MAEETKSEEQNLAKGKARRGQGIASKIKEFQEDVQNRAQSHAQNKTYEQPQISQIDQEELEEKFREKEYVSQHNEVNDLTEEQINKATKSSLPDANNDSLNATIRDLQNTKIDPYEQKLAESNPPTNVTSHPMESTQQQQQVEKVCKSLNEFSLFFVYFPFLTAGDRDARH